MRLLPATLLVGAVASGHLAAQSFTIGPQLTIADYRETSADLHYRGFGVGGGASFTFKKLAAEVAYTRLSYDPAEDGGAVTPFDATQFDVRLRYYLAGPASAELGLMSRQVDPDFTAQEAAAVRVGVRLSELVDPAVRLSLRGNYLAGAQFSGGGSASFGLELGMSVGADLARGRVRLSAEYEFQHFNRKTNDGSGDVNVPIQQALGRMGVSVTF